MIWKPACDSRWIIFEKQRPNTFLFCGLQSQTLNRKGRKDSRKIRKEIAHGAWLTTEDRRLLLREAIFRGMRGNQLLYLLPLVGCVKAELYSHPEAGMHDLNFPSNP